ncbi:MAG: hypothetical protein QXK88_06920 [Desulfurococcaceae archaeon]
MSTIRPISPISSRTRPATNTSTLTTISNNIAPTIIRTGPHTNPILIRDAGVEYRGSARASTRIPGTKYAYNPTRPTKAPVNINPTSTTGDVSVKLTRKEVHGEPLSTIIVKSFSSLVISMRGSAACMNSIYSTRIRPVPSSR